MKEKVLSLENYPLQAYLFEPNVKIQILKELKDDSEIIFCINARHIISKKLREDYGLTYDNELLRLIGCMRDIGLSVCGVVINFYEDHPLIEDFKPEMIADPAAHSRSKIYMSRESCKYNSGTRIFAVKADEKAYCAHEERRLP